MIYLDYAAHTPADKEVLDAFYNAEMNFTGNPNSHHKVGIAAKKRLDECTSEIEKMLNLADSEIIYTSGATESNNLAIKGAAKEYSKYGKHIITTYLEHSSVTGSIMDLQNQGFEVDFVEITKDGSVDLEHLRELLRDDTILISICYVDSEAGTLQNIDEIGKLVHEYPHCVFHTDATQAIGKIAVNLEDVDLATFSAHKFYGISGIGALIKKRDILLSPILHGGISTTTFRSGTPPLSLIVSLEKALSLVMRSVDENKNQAQKLNTVIKNEVSKYKNIALNTPINCSPYIINVSPIGVKSEKLLNALDENEVFLSSKSACCAVNTPSRPIYAITKDKKRALNTLRISLSHKTTLEEVNQFIEIFDNCFTKLLKE